MVTSTPYFISEKPKMRLSGDAGDRAVMAAAPAAGARDDKIPQVS